MSTYKGPPITSVRNARSADGRGGHITVFKEGESLTARHDHPKFDQIESLYLDLKQKQADGVSPDWSPLYDLMAPVRVITQKFAASEYSDEVRIDNGVITYQGRVIHNDCTTVIIENFRNGVEVGHLVAFLARVCENPSYQSSLSLFKFLDNEGLPITDKGTFLAYKSVDDNYKDHHTHTEDNSVGAEPSMPRNACDDNRAVACSLGYHIGNWDYASNFTGAPHLMIVECDPADVVSVPSDASQGKIRVCKYKVIAEITGKREPLPATSYLSGRDPYKPAPVAEPETNYESDTSGYNGPLVVDQVDNETLSALYGFNVSEYLNSLSDEAAAADREQFLWLRSFLLRIYGGFQDPVQEIKEWLNSKHFECDYPLESLTEGRIDDVIEAARSAASDNGCCSECGVELDDENSDNDDAKCYDCN